MWHLPSGCIGASNSLMEFLIAENFCRRKSLWLFVHGLWFMKIFPTDILLYYIAVCLHIEGEIRWNVFRENFNFKTFLLQNCLLYGSYITPKIERVSSPGCTVHSAINYVIMVLMESHVNYGHVRFQCAIGTVLKPWNNHIQGHCGTVLVY